LSLCGKSEKEYAVAFTLNTTYGINLVLHQLPADSYDRIITSTIEHNSVFLPAITWAQRNHKERLILQRSEDGSLVYEQGQIQADNRPRQ
jgi:selenocysteine lyase/cysteine desulfurase